MDEELRAFLTERFDAIDQRFVGTDQRFNELRRELDERFARIDQRFAGVDERFVELRDELTGRIDGARDELGGRIDGALDELGGRIDQVRRETGVIAEAQRDQIRLIAEGHSLLVGRIDGLERAIDSMGREILAAVKFSYAELDRRITRLEVLTVDLEARLSRLERDRSGGGGP
jgi:hypothetical protein